MKRMEDYIVIGKGYENPWGTGQEYAWVRVGVSFFRPLANPYPGRGSMGRQGFWLRVWLLVFYYTNARKFKKIHE